MRGEDIIAGLSPPIGNVLSDRLLIDDVLLCIGQLCVMTYYFKIGTKGYNLFLCVKIALCFATELSL